MLRKHKKAVLAFLLKQKDTYCRRKGLLYRKLRHCNRDEYTFQFVLPSKYRNQALKGCHDDITHLGVERYLDLLRDRFDWLTMAKDMESHVRQCDRCLYFKQKP